MESKTVEEQIDDIITYLDQNDPEHMKLARERVKNGKYRRENRSIECAL